MTAQQKAGPTGIGPAASRLHDVSGVSVRGIAQVVKARTPADRGPAFAPCSYCRREVQVVRRAGGLRYRIHTGRLTKWCPGSHQPVEVIREQPEPMTFDELAAALRDRHWHELIVVPLWGGAP